MTLQKKHRHLNFPGELILAKQTENVPEEKHFSKDTASKNKNVSVTTDQLTAVTKKNKSHWEKVLIHHSLHNMMTVVES